MQRKRAQKQRQSRRPGQDLAEPEVRAGQQSRSPGRASRVGVQGGAGRAGSLTVSSWTGADSVGSRTGGESVGSRTGADSVGSRTGVDSVGSEDSSAGRMHYIDSHEGF